MYPLAFYHFSIQKHFVTTVFFDSGTELAERVLKSYGFIKANVLKRKLNNMSKSYISGSLLFTLLCLFTSSQVFAQVFVDVNAAGTNDGSSWENAYNNLQQALDDLPVVGNDDPKPQVWVAGGTYTGIMASAPDIDAFVIEKPVDIYGGFAGTEQTIEERDLNLNETIISGDANRDDIKENFVDNRTDNFVRVLYIDSTFTNTVVLDGLTISGGHTSANPDTAFHIRTGGGVFTWNPVEVRNCTFESNFSPRGGSVYLSWWTDGSVFDNCTFQNNSTDARASCMFVDSNWDLTIRNCEFKDNISSRGAVYLLFCKNTIVENCTFSNNDGTGNFCGGLYNWNSESVNVVNCNFDNNRSMVGAAVYVDGRDLSNTAMYFDNCSFTNNEVISDRFESIGGTMYSTRAITSFENCTFDANSGDAFAGNLAFYTNSRGTVKNCIFTNNEATSGGAAFAAAFGFDVLVENCTFEDNQAGWGAGVFLQGEPDTAVFVNCEFNNNRADDLGGAAVYALGGVKSSWTGCSFVSNKATEDRGGAIYCSEDLTDAMKMDINRCYFAFNQSVGQGGAIDVTNTDLNVTNSIFFSNLTNEEQNATWATGRGGAIINNASHYVNFGNGEIFGRDSDLATVNLLNNSFINNDGELAGSIAQYQYEDDTLTTEAKMILQNNLFYYTSDIIAPHYGIEAGAPTVVSYGGNASYDEAELDESWKGLLDAVGDQMMVDVMLKDIDNEEFEPQVNSPIVNAAIIPGSPDVDFFGNNRGLRPDIGAVEYFVTTSTKDLVDNSALQLSPNPANNQLNINLENNWTGELELDITTLLGKQIDSRIINKQTALYQGLLDVSHIPVGLYQIRLSTEDQMIVKSFIKQ